MSTIYKKINLIIVLLIFISNLLLCSSSFSCEKRIEIEDKALSTKQEKSICNQIIKIEKNYQVYIYVRYVSFHDKSNTIQENEESYDNDNENYLKVKCEENEKCEDSILLTVFFNKRKIRITVGDEVKSIINNKQREKLIESMSSLLKQSKIYESLISAVNNIERYLSKESKTRKESSFSFSSILSYILTEWSFILGLMIIIFIIISSLLFSSSSTSTEMSKVVIQHVSQLNDLYSQAQSQIITWQCLLCMKPLHINDSNISIFSCRHVYHSTCVTIGRRSEFKIDTYCLMCDEPTGVLFNDGRFIPEDRSGGKYENSINRRNLYNILYNFDKLYTNLELREAYITDKDSFNSIRTQFEIKDGWMFDEKIVSNQYMNNEENGCSNGNGYSFSSSNRTRISSDSTKLYTSSGDYSKFYTSGGDYNCKNESSSKTSGGDY